MNHIDQEAELYALGLLDEDERARIDVHVATCIACAQRLGQAEAALTALVDATTRLSAARPPARWPLAVAAAFALASAALLEQNLGLHGALNADGALLAALVDSHFDHAQFASVHGPIAAKAIYERHGAWYEIVADGAPSWRVVFVRPDGTREAATAPFARRGAASIMYVAHAAPVRSIELEDAAGHVIAGVRPTLQVETE